MKIMGPHFKGAVGQSSQACRFYVDHVVLICVWPVERFRPMWSDETGTEKRFHAGFLPISLSVRIHEGILRVSAWKFEPPFCDSNRQYHRKSMRALPAIMREINSKRLIPAKMTPKHIVRFLGLTETQKLPIRELCFQQSSRSDERHYPLYSCLSVVLYS